MRASPLIPARAWEASLVGLVSRQVRLTQSMSPVSRSFTSNQKQNVKIRSEPITPSYGSRAIPRRAGESFRITVHEAILRNSSWKPAIAHLRAFTTTARKSQVNRTPAAGTESLIETERAKNENVETPTAPPIDETWQEKARREEEEEDRLEELGLNKKEDEASQLADGQAFKPSEKAARAAQVNLSARLQQDGKIKGNWSGFKETWRLIVIARPEAKWLGLAFCFLLTSSAITMAIPFSIGKILDLATQAQDGDGLLYGLTMPQFYCALAGILTIGAGANYGRIVILRIVGERIVARLRSQLYRRTYIQDAEFFDANRVGDLISRLSSDTVIVGKSITQNLSDGLRAIVSGGAGFTAMAWVSLKLSSVLLIMFPPMAFGAFFYGRFQRSISRKIQRNLGTLTKIAEERLGNVKTSQAFAGEIQEVGRYNRQVKKIFALGKREALVSATFFSSTGFIGNMTIMTILYAGGSMVKSGAISIGELTSFLMYAAYAGSSMFGVTGFFSELMKGVGAATRLFELQDKKPNINPTAGLPVKSAQGPIKFSNVSFAYPTRPALPIFEGLDFEIPSGTNVAIVGPSGGGKSTISSLLLRFYKPTEGTVTINGVDISKMNGKALRRRIGFVGQEPVLMSGSIAENIAYGKPHATRNEIVAAAKKANCQFIEDFPDGLDTSVGARGAQLSGGQKQRIAIARALLKEPDILILDEATSALDAESETLVNSALAALLKGHNTTISIAHRLSTIKRSDTIIVLGNNGKVAEQGSYKALSANPHSAFSLLMEWQMSGGDAADKRPVEPEGHVTTQEEITDDLERLEKEEDDMIEDQGAAKMNSQSVVEERRG